MYFPSMNIFTLCLERDHISMHDAEQEANWANGTLSNDNPNTFGADLTLFGVLSNYHLPYQCINPQMYIPPLGIQGLFLWTSSCYSHAMHMQPRPVVHLCCVVHMTSAIQNANHISVPP